MSNLVPYQGELKIQGTQVLYLNPVTKQAEPIRNEHADRLVAALQAVAKGDHSQVQLVQHLQQQCLATAALANKAMDYQQELLLEQQRTISAQSQALAERQRGRVVHETRYVEHYYDGTVAAILTATFGTMAITAFACLIASISASFRPVHSELPAIEVKV